MLHLGERIALAGKRCGIPGQCVEEAAALGNEASYQRLCGIGRLHGLDRRHIGEGLMRSTRLLPSGRK
jgi:hypothetical protein